MTKEINIDNLPSIQETLRQRARKCSQQRNYGKGQQCSLMNDLEGTYAAIQMLKKKKEKMQVCNNISAILICFLIIHHCLKLFFATSKQRKKFIKIITAGKKASVLIEKINN